MMADDILKKIPQPLQSRISNMALAEKWSEEWQKEATEICYRIAVLRDEGVITEAERKYINRTYLKSVGVLSKDNQDFLHFFLRGARDEV